MHRYPATRRDHFVLVQDRLLEVQDGSLVELEDRDIPRQAKPERAAVKPGGHQHHLPASVFHGPQDVLIIERCALAEIEPERVPQRGRAIIQAGPSRGSCLRRMRLRQ